ncbi:hypothetical protein B0H65DRAFT_127992 [Neurospora tetraspora]|uniref:Uncharacterized protein n=1 Tax=Neurospora tetraspora TaxID=94610 RepID=A0AAE0JL26_9PEZI|nr:hypothetical protein B0H65DRAFT_127992 [Neurospora tetraspora]
MVVLRTLAALAVTTVVSMASELPRFSRFSIPGHLAMHFGDKVVPGNKDVTLTTQPPKLGTFERLSGSSYTAVAVQPYDVLVDSIDSNLLWLQTGLKPSAFLTKFEPSERWFFEVYELLNEANKPAIMPWSPSNLQGPEQASVFTLLFDTSNISPQDELYLQNAALNPERFNFVDTMEHTQLADKVAAGALFLATAASTKKPSSVEKTAKLLEPLQFTQGAQVPMFHRRDSEASARPQEPEAIVTPAIHLAQDRTTTVTTTATTTATTTTTTTAIPTSYYPMVMETGSPDSHSSASHNRMTVFGLVSVAAMLFAL